MKNISINKVLALLIIVVSLSGCFGINPSEWSVQAQIDPDLSGVFLLETKFSETDLNNYAQNNSISSPEAVLNKLANNIASQLGWDFPYEVAARPDKDNSSYIWMQMQVKFDRPETLCRIFPDEDVEQKAKAADLIGQENILECELTKSSTPFTDIYTFQETIYPNSTTGNFIVALPGVIIDSTGSPYNQVGTIWTWDEGDVAIPLVLISGGLSDFKVDLLVDIKGDANDLKLEVTVPQEVILYAKTVYPEIEHPINALADRMANGLNLPPYSVDVRELGSEVVIVISINGLSDVELQTALNDSGLMSDVIIKSKKTILNSKYEFNGVLNPWKKGYGYPKNITLKINSASQSEIQSWVADESAQSVSASGSSTNWLLIGVIGILGFIIVGIGIALLGGGVFLWRRKKV